MLATRIPHPAATALALAVVLAWPVAAAPAAPATGQAGHPAATTANDHRQQQLQAEQRELRTRLAQLKKQLAATEAAHAEATDALAASESAISDANRRLRQLAQARRRLEGEIRDLRGRRLEAARDQDQHESGLGRALRERWLLAQRPGWQSALAGDDPDQLARESAYLGYLARERLRRIRELHGEREVLAGLEQQSRAKQEELAAVAEEERAGRGQLLRQQASRRQVLARLGHDLARQRASVGDLERDQARLSALIGKLGELLAQQARRRARPEHPGPARPPAAERGVEPPADSRFAQLRGHLALPVHGQIVGRFGAERLAEDGSPQPGAPTWKGLFIRTRAGEEVHAVAAGRVVFADWLRGFGNLMILDHGEGFLSVYGNNESLLRAVGEPVATGEVVAVAGDTGGGGQSGLYFELRYQGRPVDPSAWVASR